MTVYPLLPRSDSRLEGTKYKQGSLCSLFSLKLGIKGSVDNSCSSMNETVVSKITIDIFPKRQSVVLLAGRFNPRNDVVFSDRKPDGTSCPLSCVQCTVARRGYLEINSACVEQSC
jgi:hypothetical protein